MLENVKAYVLDSFSESTPNFLDVYERWADKAKPAKVNVMELLRESRDLFVRFIAPDADEKLDLPDEWRIKLEFQTKIAVRDFDTQQVDLFICCMNVVSDMWT